MRRIQETGYFIFCAEPAVTGQGLSESEESGRLLMTFANVEEFGVKFLNGILSFENPAVDWSGLQNFIENLQPLYQARFVKDDIFSSIFKSVPVTRYNSLYLPRFCLMSLIVLSELQTAPETFICLSQSISPHGSISDQICQWIDFFPSKLLEKVIHSLQKCISSQFESLSSPSSFDRFYSTLHLLNLVWRSNDRQMRVDYKEFYNKEINKKMDIPEEYKKWKVSLIERKRKFSSKWFSILDFPFLLDCEMKTRLLQHEHYEAVEYQLTQFFIVSIISGVMESPYFQLEISRENMVEDSIKQFTRKDINLKKPLRVKFIGEEGVDEGGVKKEFFHLLIKKLFEDSHQIFSYKTSERVYWFNPASGDLKLFELFGIVLGLAIFNCVNVDINFPTALYKKLQNSCVSIADLSEIDKSAQSSLSHLLETKEDVSSLSLSFVIETEVQGLRSQHELIKGGKDLQVTNSNREEFVKLYADWLLNQGIQEQFESFRKGFNKICGGGVVNLIRPEELGLVLCGKPVIDLRELEKVAVYENGFTRETHTVEMLWKILHSLEVEDKKKFLFFVTGSDRVPAGGFSSIQFVISRNGPDSDRIMTAHTCYNYLLLPEYTCETKMRKLLLLAINNSEGFGLR
jgi:ubiquitin-protein ligase E3 A